MGLFLRMGILAAAVVVTAPAMADSRLFSVKTDTPGVTVEEALVGGKPLAVSGKGGGVTFFRLDSQGEVPCTERVTFVASTGARKDADVPLCPQNWNFAVSFAAAAAPQAPAASQAPAAPPPAAAAEPPAPPVAAAPPAPPAAAAQPATPAAPTTGARTLTIATDDPQVGIDSIYIDRQAVTIVTRQGNGVEVQIPAGACRRDVGLKLTDGRTIARQMDLCPQGGSVLVMLGSGSEVAEQPAQPAAPAQPAMPAQPSPPPAEASAPVVAEGAWSYTAGDGNAILSFGVPDSDDGTFSAVCRLTSGRANVELLRMADGLQENAPVEVTLFAGAFTKTYPAKGSPVSQMDGGSHPAFAAPASDPLWAALAKEAQLVVSVGGGESYAISLKGSAGPVRQFLAACSPTPPPAPVAAAPAGGRTVNYVCQGGGSLSVTFAPGLRSVFIAEAGQPPIQLAGGPTGEASARFVSPPASLVGNGESIRWSRTGEPPRVCFPR
jgi:hypothetical protein